MKQVGKRFSAWMLAAALAVSAPGPALYAAGAEGAPAAAGEAVVGEGSAQEGSGERTEIAVSGQTEGAPAATGEAVVGEEPVSEGESDPHAVRAAKSNAEARNGSPIDMQYDGFVFANGTSIVIKEVEGVTGIYDTDGNLLSEGVAVSECAIYGGWYDGDNTHTGNTSIVMESGTINCIFGGSFSGTLNGDTCVTLNGGTVGWVYGGGNQSNVTGSAQVTVNKGAEIWGPKLSDGEAEDKGTVFGGGYMGSVESTEVVINGGDAGWVYGGGEKDTVNSTHVSLLEMTDDFTNVYGGGKEGTVQKAVLKLCAEPSGWCYGGGYNGSVGEAEIIISGSWERSGGTSIYGGGAGESGSVGSAVFRVSLTQSVQGGSVKVLPGLGDGLKGAGVTGSVSADFSGIGEISYDYSAYLSDVDQVRIENCRVSFQGEQDQGVFVSEVKLGRLDTGTAGVALFPVRLTSISIGELAGSGSIVYQFGEKSDGKVPAAEVGKVSASASAPIKIGRTGSGITDEQWENAVLLQGNGIKELESAACFVSDLDRFVLVKDGDTVKVKKGDGRIQAYLDAPHFDQPSYRYGDQMTIHLGLHAQNQAPVSGATVEIRAGKISPYKTVASAVTDEEGRATLFLPMNDLLWESCQHGLQAAFLGNESYKPNYYGVSLGGGGDMSFEVEKASVTLDQAIAAPVLGGAPVRMLDTKDSDFYTAQVIWSPPSIVFQPDTAYTASVKLIPETGYSFTKEKIESITYQGRELAVPEQSGSDGSLLLQDVERFAAIPTYEVRFAASSLEGVEGASGAGRYAPGSEVKINAGSRPGYTFAGWSAPEGVTFADSSQAQTTFVMPGYDVELTANWKEITYKVTFAEASLEGVEGASGAGRYAPGSEVKINAGSRPGYTFAGWSAPEGVTFADSSQAQTTFVMPGYDVTLTASWKKSVYGDVLPEDVPSDGKIPDGLWIAGVEESYLYTGAAIKPAVRVYDHDKRLTEKQDYTVSYKNNKKANDASDLKTAPLVTVKGKGNYKDVDTAVFAIRAVDLNSADVTAENMTAAYNRKVQRKVPILLFKGKKLSANRDFTVSYPDIETGKPDAFKAPGEYEIVLKGKGNFTGNRTVTFTVTDKNLMGKVSVKRIPNESYDGNEKKPALTVSAGKKKLTAGVDYEAEYTDNVEVGTATVILTGIGDYAGTKKATFKITGTSIKSARVDPITGVIYDGTPREPEITVRMGDQVLTEGVDYRAEYTGNVNAGTAAVTVTGLRAYTGTVRKTFRIEPCDLTESLKEQLKGEIQSKYMKGGCRPSPALFCEGAELTEGKDYTVSYRGNRAVTTSGTRNMPSFTVKGKGNYKGTFTKEFTILPKALDDGESPVKLIVSDKAYANRAGGYVSKPVLTDADGRKLTAGKDYVGPVYTRPDGTLLTKQDKVQAGETVKVKVTGIGAYTGELEAEYRITELNFARAKITIPAQTYTGREITLREEALVVKVGRETLNPGTDYEIVQDSYVNHIKKGTASVTVRGKGSYGGRKTVKFRIVQRKMEWFRTPEDKTPDQTGEYRK